MNWILVIMLWGRHSETVTQIPFQTKFLCEKAIDTLDYVNTTNQIPVGTWARCVQVHKVDKNKLQILEQPAKPAPQPDQSVNEEPESSNG